MVEELVSAISCTPPANTLGFPRARSAALKPWRRSMEAACKSAPAIASGLDELMQWGDEQPCRCKCSNCSKGTHQFALLNQMDCKHGPEEPCEAVRLLLQCATLRPTSEQPNKRRQCRHCADSHVPLLIRAPQQHILRTQKTHDACAQACCCL